MKNCSHCGSENTLPAQFCSACGQAFQNEVESFTTRSVFKSDLFFLRNLIWIIPLGYYPTLAFGFDVHRNFKLVWHYYELTKEKEFAKGIEHFIDIFAIASHRLKAKRHVLPAPTDDATFLFPKMIVFCQTLVRMISSLRLHY